MRSETIHEIEKKELLAQRRPIGKTSKKNGNVMTRSVSLEREMNASARSAYSNVYPGTLNLCKAAEVVSLT